MDDKTFMAAYVANEATRIKDRLKETVQRGEMPSEEEKEALMQDMETTLSRLQQALIQLQTMVDAEDEDGEAVRVLEN